MKQPVEYLLKASDVNLNNGGGLKEIEHFKIYLSGYKIIVYDDLTPDGVIFSGNSLSNKELYLLYDLDFENFSVLRNPKLLWQGSTYVIRVIHCTTIHTSVTKLAPGGRLDDPVRKISQSNVVHVTDGS